MNTTGRSRRETDPVADAEGDEHPAQGVRGSADGKRIRPAIEAALAMARREQAERHKRRKLRARHRRRRPVLIILAPLVLIPTVAAMIAGVHVCRHYHVTAHSGPVTIVAGEAVTLPTGQRIALRGAAVVYTHEQGRAVAVYGPFALALGSNSALKVSRRRLLTRPVAFRMDLEGRGAIGLAVARRVGAGSYVNLATDHVNITARATEVTQVGLSSGPRDTAVVARAGTVLTEPVDRPWNGAFIEAGQTGVCTPDRTSLSGGAPSRDVAALSALAARAARGTGLEGPLRRMGASVIAAGGASRAMPPEL